MNVRLRKTMSWLSSYVHLGQFNTNHYTATFDLQTVSDDHNQQNVAYERLKFWIQDVMQDSVMIRHTDADFKKWAQTGAKILAFPDDPVDQLVGMMLCAKLNAIMEDRIICTNVEIYSELGEAMSYLHNWKESMGPLHSPGWWNDSRPNWSSSVPGRRDKVIALDRAPDWKEHDLDWVSAADAKDGSVVFATFERDENQ